MKKALQEPSTKDKEEEERQKRAIREKYLTASFKELCDMTSAMKPESSLHSCLNELFNKQLYNESSGTVGSDTVDINTKKFSNEFEEYFPELFMY